MSDEGWPRTGPVDGPALVAAAGRGLTYAGRLAGGNAGAVAAHRPDGTPVVLTYWDAGTVGRAGLIAELTGRLRAVGYPVPAYELVPMGTGAVVLADRVDGTPDARPTPRLVEQVLGLVDLQAGLAPQAGGRLADLHLSEDGVGYCLHGPLRQHSAASRALLDWIEEVGRSAPADAFRGTDVVHHDLHLDNVLVGPDGAVAGVVDWAGVRVGDRVLDLVTFGFDLTYRGGDPAPVRDRLTDAARPYVAHLALRWVDWTIRHGPDPDRWIEVAAGWRRWAG